MGSSPYSGRTFASLGSARPRERVRLIVMKRALFVLASVASLLVSAAAAADDACVPEPHVQCLKVVTIYGRAPKPMVVIELRHKPAAASAGEAHEAMRARWMQSLVPATLRH